MLVIVFEGLIIIIYCLYCIKIYSEFGLNFFNCICIEDIVLMMLER